MKQTSDLDGVPFIAGVLAGGGSTRMGQPKALLTLPNGKTIIEHVVDTAGSVANQVVILGQACPFPESLAKLQVLPDGKPDSGPLAGLYSLLTYSKDQWTFLLACDMPFVTTQLLRKVAQQAQDNLDAIVFEKETGPHTCHTCCAGYHPRILPTVTDELFEGESRMQSVLARVRQKLLKPNSDEIHMLTNANTPDDLSGITGF